MNVMKAGESLEEAHETIECHVNLTSSGAIWELPRSSFLGMFLMTSWTWKIHSSFEICFFPCRKRVAEFSGSQVALTTNNSRFPSTNYSKDRSFTDPGGPRLHPR
mmetsp:Transcript_3018/g.5785  ORF Transcript_3018/g.5785 Transcript_3018/m.5785 type:complete len:105 (-) Transcript_3018:283-597(-)